MGDCAIDHVVGISLRCDDRRRAEVFGGWWGRDRPLETGGVPWIRCSNGPVAQAPQKIRSSDEVAEGHYGCACGRHDVEHLELLGIRGIAARHAEIAEHKLRSKGDEESDEDANG